MALAAALWHGRRRRPAARQDPAAGPAAGISLRTVQRIWEANGFQPHRIRTFKRSNDPPFAEKVEDIVGLYMDPPAHAIVLSIDEAGTLYLINASGIAGGVQAITIDASNQAAVEMLDDSLVQDALAGTGTTQASMFQTDSTALRAFVWFGAERSRDYSVAGLTGINW